MVGAALPALLVSGDAGARELVRVTSSGLPLPVKPVWLARLRATLHARWHAGMPRPPREAAQRRTAGVA